MKEHASKDSWTMTILVLILNSLIFIYLLFDSFIMWGNNVFFVFLIPLQLILNFLVFVVVEILSAIKVIHKPALRRVARGMGAFPAFAFLLGLGVCSLFIRGGFGA